ncbi:MAG TPA: AcvB/VirJ family lysyl-phosphatidylglycerol hydrolase [Rhodanobacteraceae bacterium]|nr:AcvB/VirJ family lysyl-phosphatidylglycerol hydrolase [Rhodanobacteraceae bacterium]
MSARLVAFAIAGIVASLCAPSHVRAALRIDAPSASEGGTQGPTSQPRTETLDYGLFGALHLTRPSGDAAQTVLFFSDRDGWSLRQDDLAGALAREGAFVVGIDLPTYLRKLEGLSGKCSYPAGHVEEVAHWIERHEGFATYTYPLVVGDGSGATFAYALVAQAPAGTFAGLVTLGWDEAFRLPKAFCTGDAGAMTAADGGAFRVVPVDHLPATWIPKPFASGARASGLLADARVGVDAFDALVHPRASQEANRDLAATFAHWRRREMSARVALPDDVADLPITDLPPTRGDAHRIAIVITGDGGWAGLDRGVAAALNADGVRVIGFSTLKFFWHKQTPDAAAQAIARVIAHYGKTQPAARFVLIGYSFGASLVPVVANRLPDAARARVDGGILISPDDEAVFEIHVGDWFGSTHHDEALPIGPEIAASKVPLVCVHGVDESDSFCLKPQPAQMKVVTLPGGHHYNGDYAALGDVIVKNLPASGAVGK